MKGEQSWQPLYFLAEHDYLLPNEIFKTLFDTPQFKMISGSISTSQWEVYSREISNGGSFSVSLKDGDHLTIVFKPWTQSGPYFATGYEARSGWNRTWPHVRIDFKGPSGAIESSLWTLMANAAITYDVPYSSISEAVSEIFKINEDRLEFRRGDFPEGSVLFPIFAAFDLAKYDRSEQKLRLVARIIYHSKATPERLYVSAKLEASDKRVERARRTRLKSGKVVGPEKELCRVEWSSPVELPAASVRYARVNLVYDPIDDSPVLIDQEYLRLVSALTNNSEIKRLMEEKSDRRRVDYWTKLEKGLLDGKGDAFEEAMFTLLSRAGFDVSWESKNNPFDIFAASPNGCLVVECTRDPPSVAMAQELKELAESYVNEKNPRVLPVLATNQTASGDLDQDMNRMHQDGGVYFLTRDRLKQLLDAVRQESLVRTEKYLERHFTW